MTVDSVTIPIQKFIYARLRPVVVASSYRLRGSDLTEPFIDLPPSPAQYLQLPDVRKQQPDSEQAVFSDGNWLPSFFDYEEPEPFNDLCLWYRTRIRCECRLIVHQAEQWLQDLTTPQTLFLYKLITVQRTLTGLLAEVRRQASGQSTPADAGIKQMKQYVNLLLERELFALLFELNERYGYLLEDLCISPRDLYLKHLKTPLPSSNPVVTAPAFYRHFAEKALYNPSLAEELKQLITRARQEYRQTNHPPFRASLNESVHFLENMTLIYLTLAEEKQQAPVHLLNEEENRNQIRTWIHELLQEERLPARHALNKLLPRLRTFFRVCGEQPPDAGHLSPARELIRRLKNFFDQPQKSVDDIDGAPRTEEPQALSPLNDYILKEDIRQRFGWDHKKLNRLLREADIEVIYFSKKEQWIHTNDLKTLMEFHKQPVP